jgi:FMN-dependent NADH-azoreductase
VDDPRFVDAQPLQFSDQEARTAALVRAKEELGGVAAEWAASEYARPGVEALEALEAA